MHKQSYWFDAATGREVYMPERDGKRESIKLHMSSNNLGWYWIEEIKDPSVIRQLLAGANVLVKDVIAPTVVPSISSMRCESSHARYEPPTHSAPIHAVFEPSAATPISTP